MRQLSPPILFVLLLFIANATNREVKEIRFKTPVARIRQKPKMGYKFILTDIRPVRRYLIEKALNC
jgi:hypothetical protein